MAAFSKAFPFLQRFHFPPFGEPLNPRQVSAEVVLTHELFRADFKHALRLETSVNSTAGVGAGVTHVAIPEPPAGYVAIPYLLAVGQAGAAATREVSWETPVTGTAADLPTGVWPLVAWFRINIVTLDKQVLLPCRLPIPRGNRLDVVWGAVAVGDTVTTRCAYCLMPIECVDWQDFATQSAAHTGAI